jgi:hypothetical protein
MMPPQINTKLCLLAFAMLLGTCASSAACLISPCPEQGRLYPGYPTMNQAGRSNDTVLGNSGNNLTGSNNFSFGVPERRLIENRPFQFGCPRPPCRGGIVD